MKKIIKRVLQHYGYEIKRTKERVTNYADSKQLGKATSYIERYREIISDPINVLIRRVPEAGYVDGSGLVVLHNGNRVPLEGNFAYYEEFSDILLLNRGVHEPLEEFCFQQVLRKIITPFPV